MVAQFGDLLEYPPSIAGNKLFYATNGGGQGGQVIARDLTGGHELWRYHVTGGGQFASEPTYDGGRLYIGTMGPHTGRGSAHYHPGLLALDAGTNNPKGTLLWNFPTGHAVESSPLVLRGRLYFASQAGVFYCLDARSGRLLWRRDLHAKVTASPAYSAGRLIIATYGGSVWALGPARGTLTWKTTLRGQFYGTPAISGNHVIVASKSNGRLYCLDLRSGRLGWSYATNQGLYASPAVWNNTVYIGGKFKGFWALDARSGHPIWPKKSFSGPIYGSASLLNGTVYFATLPAHGKSKGATYGLDARTGKLRWSFHDGYYSPITATGSMILLTGQSTIYAFKAGH